MLTALPRFEGRNSDAVRAERLSEPLSEPDGTLSGNAAGVRLLAQVLDEIDYGVLLLAQGQWVVFANRAVCQLCELPQFPCHLTSNRRLKLANELEQEVLDRALLMAATQARRSLVRVTYGNRSLLLATVPLAAGRPDAAAAGQFPRIDTRPGVGDVLILFSRRQTCETLSVEFFARASGLTHAETAVLSALCRGAQPSQIASAAGVAVSTVRTQVSSIRQKTGAGSIAELVRQVAVLPPIVPALSSTQTH
jgi:DNA-binding CsgD family transcriptional regulator